VCSHEGLSLAGVLRMVGGPAGAHSEPVPGTVTATRLATAGPPYSCTVTVGAAGNFTVVLAPGTYRVQGRSPKFAEGRVDCNAAGELVILPASANGMIPNGQNLFVSF